MRSSPEALGVTSARCTCLLVVTLSIVACNPGGGAPQRLSIATGGTGGMYYPYGGGIAKIISDHVPNVEATAEVTSASVDNLKFLRDGSVDLVLTLADTLDDAIKGQGLFGDAGPVPARTLAVLYTNYTHVVTTAASGIASVSAMRDHVISTGAPGSGTEVIAFRMLRTAGLDPASDILRQSLGATASVDALRDGKIDGFFWSGGVPTAAILDLASTPGVEMRLLPHGDLVSRLQERFGATLYFDLPLPASAYPGQADDVPVAGVANVLAVSSAMSEELAHAITRALFAHKDELAAIHPQARRLGPSSAVTGSPAPFHDGAIRYYREQNVWPE